MYLSTGTVGYRGVQLNAVMGSVTVKLLVVLIGLVCLCISSLGRNVDHNRKSDMVQDVIDTEELIEGDSIIHNERTSKDIIKQFNTGVKDNEGTKVEEDGNQQQNEGDPSEDGKKKKAEEGKKNETEKRVEDLSNCDKEGEKGHNECNAEGKVCRETETPEGYECKSCEEGLILKEKQCIDPCEEDDWKERCKEIGQCVVNADKDGATCRCNNENEIYVPNGENGDCKDFCGDEEAGRKDCDEKNKKCISVQKEPYYDCTKCLPRFNEVGDNCVDYCTDGQPGKQECNDEHRDCKPSKTEPFYNCTNCSTGFTLSGDECVDYCAEGQAGKEACDAANKKCNPTKSDSFYTCGDCLEGFKPAQNDCIDYCQEGEDGYRECIIGAHKNCTATKKMPYFDCAGCLPDYIEKGSECIDPCKENDKEWEKKCKALGRCKINKKKDGATCECTGEKQVYLSDENACEDFCAKEGNNKCNEAHKECHPADENPFYECKDCLAGFNSKGEECIDYCQEGEEGYKNCTEKEFRICVPTIADPFFNCTDCLSPYIEKEGTCIDECNQKVESKKKTWNETCQAEDADCVANDDKTSVTCRCRNESLLFNPAELLCRAPCDKDGGIGYAECSRAGRLCEVGEGTYECTSCINTTLSVEDEVCVDLCETNRSGEVNCSRQNRVCELLPGEGYKCGNCTEGYDDKDGECVELNPCDPNPCQHDGICEKIDGHQFSCTCKDPWYGKTCEHEDTCKSDNHGCAEDSKCVYNAEYHTFSCQCNGDDYYDYLESACKKFVKCSLIKSPGKFEECDEETGEWTCKEGYNRTEDGTCNMTPQYCKEMCETDNVKCNAVQGPNSDFNIECICEDGYYRDPVSSKCKASACLPVTKLSPCDYFCEINSTTGQPVCSCSESFTGSEKCEVKENNKCNDTSAEKCKNGGECVKENGEEKCTCFRGYTLSDDGTCVDICEADHSSVKEFCPSGCLRENNEIKCNCTGEYTEAEDGVTCRKKSLCSLGEQGEIDCTKKNAYCEQLNSTAYECHCRGGQRFVDDVCSGSCSDKEKLACASTQRSCDYIGGQSQCFCPLLMVYNEEKKTCVFAKNAFFITLSLPLKEAVQNKVYAPTSENADKKLNIIKAMENLYGDSLDTANLVSCSSGESDDVEQCIISLTFKTGGSGKRILLKDSCMTPANVALKAGYCVLPPSLIVANSSLQEESLSSNMCDDEVRSTFCPITTNDCKQATRELSCTCKPGFKPINTFQLGGNPEAKVEVCEDVDECQNNPCWEHSECKNTPGSYECVCKEGYTLTEDKTKCQGVCDVKPCQNNGECSVVGDTYECKCTKGYKGRNCEIEDDYLKRANTNMIVIGAVLGGVLFISLIVIIVLMRKIKKKFNSDYDCEGDLKDFGGAYGKNSTDRERAVKTDRYGKRGYDNPAM